MSNYPIQQGLLESLDAVLFNKALALAKDIAVDLNVSAQALIDVLKKEDKGRFMIIPDDDMAYQCHAIIQRGCTYMRCRCPTLGVTQTCSNHMSDQPSLSSLQLPSVQRIVTADAIYTMMENQIYTLSGDHCGILDGSTLTLFEIEEV